MAAYMIQHIKPNLVYIRWTRNSKTADENLFIHELSNLLDNAEEVIYFISDLRKGRIIGMRAIYKLSQLTQHEKWAGSTAFSENPISRLFTNNFERNVANHDANVIYDHPEDAIAYLESLCTGITSNIDWIEILNNPSEE